MQGFFSLPIGANPDTDPIVGRDEAGNALRRSTLGHQYMVKPQADPQAMRRKQVADAMLRAAQSGQPFDPLLAERKQDIGSPLGMLGGLAQGMWQGVSAPGRAAAGEPVTYGDAWATALDYGGIANVGTAPAGALRGGSMRSDGIRAYHGSPHDFDRFSMDKIGTGEGAQAYGHGLYFAESEDVARSYRDNLAGLNTQKIADIARRKPHLKAAIESMREDGLDDAQISSALKRAYGETSQDDIAAAFLAANDMPGRMYEVRINADPDAFVDWDAPLAEQPEQVQAGLRNLWGPFYERNLQNFNMSHGQDIAARTMDPSSGQSYVRELRDAGIPGIKYRDAGSRGIDGGNGTRNFVVFDDNLIEIVRKYGIAGAAAMLGVSVADIQAQMEQQ